MTQITDWHPLMKRCPDDINWEELDTLELRRQCIVRNIPSDKTSREEKIRLLQEYQKAHVTEVRKIPWCRIEDMLPIAERRSRLGSPIYRIIRVEDKTKSGSKVAVFRKDFTLCDKEGKTCVVAFKQIPTCTCQPLVLVQYHCQHVMCKFFTPRSEPFYECCVADTDDKHVVLLRNVITCPQYLFWQAAFLPSEVHTLYRYSSVIRTLLRLDAEPRETQDTRPRCALCFTVCLGQKPFITTTCCGRVMHKDCEEAVLQMRPRKEESCCWICEDLSEWEIAKCGKPSQTPAVSVAAPALTAATMPATGASAPPTHPPPPGTAAVSFIPPTLDEPASPASPTVISKGQNIAFQQSCMNHSQEELRLADDQAGRRYSGFSNAAGVPSPFAFGSSIIGATNSGMTVVFKSEQPAGNILGANSSVRGSLLENKKATPQTSPFQQSPACKDKDHTGGGSSSPSEKKAERDAQANGKPKATHQSSKAPSLFSYFGVASPIVFGSTSFGTTLSTAAVSKSKENMGRIFGGSAGNKSNQIKSRFRFD